MFRVGHPVVNLAYAHPRPLYNDSLSPFINGFFHSLWCTATCSPQALLFHLIYSIKRMQLVYKLLWFCMWFQQGINLGPRAAYQHVRKSIFTCLTLIALIGQTPIRSFPALSLKSKNFPINKKNNNNNLRTGMKLVGMCWVSHLYQILFIKKKLWYESLQCDRLSQH